MTKQLKPIPKRNKADDAYSLLSPEQLAELERCLADNEPFASEDEARAVIDRLTK
jgi:hypothetical protein